MRSPIAATLVVLSLASLSVWADDLSRPAAKVRGASPSAPAERKAARPDRADTTSAAEREAAALAFVRAHHPELADLLEQLKAMRPDQYERAIAELSQVSRSLASLKKNDERRYRAALDVWKARSRAELLAAELVGAPNAEREGALRAALAGQIAAELRQQRLEREIVAGRLHRLDENIKRLESKRDALVESRYQSLLKKGQRARRLEAGQAAPSRSATQKGED